MIELVVLELDALGELTEGFLTLWPNLSLWVQCLLLFKLDLATRARLNLFVGDDELLDDCIERELAILINFAADAHHD